MPATVYPVIANCLNCGGGSISQETDSAVAECRSCGWHGPDSDDGQHLADWNGDPEGGYESYVPAEDGPEVVEAPRFTRTSVTGPSIPEVDPELERLLAEEEAIERSQVGRTITYNVNMAAPQPLTLSSRNRAAYPTGLNVDCPSCGERTQEQWRALPHLDAYECYWCGGRTSSRTLASLRGPDPIWRSVEAPAPREPLTVNRLNSILFGEYPQPVARITRMGPIQNREAGIAGPVFVSATPRQDGSDPNGYDLRRNLP